MKIREILNESKILLPLKSEEQNDAIQELLMHLQKIGHLSGTTKLLNNMESYEKNQSTATGKGVAFPHCTSIEINELVCVFGISKKGINYNAPDGQPCHFIILTLSPLNEPSLHRKFISKFRSMIDHGDVRTELLDSNNASSIFSIINNWEINNEQSEEL